jgi:hypothetical protein
MYVLKIVRHSRLKILFNYWKRPTDISSFLGCLSIKKEPSTVHSVSRSVGHS